MERRMGQEEGDGVLLMVSKPLQFTYFVIVLLVVIGLQMVKSQLAGFNNPAAIFTIIIRNTIFIII